ncbi:MAG TPA: hypothetical protein VEY12_07600 [Thermoplasmata archaeon]|nr:hypothetical protein [Thermoplasmata archaeon]
MTLSRVALVGLLVVLALGPAAAAASPVMLRASAVDPTSIQVIPPTGLVAGAPTTLGATLLDAVTSAAIPGENLTFARQTTFGWLPLGTVVTNAQGLASVPFAPSSSGTYTIRVVFDGDAGYTSSNITMSLTVLGGSAAPPPLLPPDRAIVLVIIGVVGGVWTTYAVVAWLVVGIRADRPEPERARVGSKVDESMTEEESTGTEGGREAGAASRAHRNAVIVATLALAIGIAAGAGGGYFMRNPTAAGSGPSPEHLYLTVAFNPGTGLDEFFPANFSVDAGVPVTITITNYDNGTNAVSTADAQVSGTIGNSESVQMWGEAAQNTTSIPVSTVSHTFSILESPYDLNVPIPASTSLSQPTVVTFTVVFDTTGTFVWRCLTPCDSTAMVTPGFMQGTVTIS